jgi:hypothetical protein
VRIDVDFDEVANAETHFSFTNALGMVSAAQSRRLAAAVSQFPDACWIVALHHLLGGISDGGRGVLGADWNRPYQRYLAASPVEAFSPPSVVMHGHQHIDSVRGTLRIRRQFGYDIYIDCCA